MENGEDMNTETEKIPNFSITVSHEAKLRELLRNITSIELQLCAEASKEFMKLLRGDEGGEMLREYVQTSSGCSELLQAWNLRQSKPSLSYIMSLISVILSHKDGVYRANDVARVSVSRILDKFARLILEEKLGDVYKVLNGKEGRGKNAALLLMSSIVRRGSGLASDVAKSFDFKLPAFLNLAEYDKRRRNVEKMKRKGSTRRSYVGFAMSFLEVGDPRLLRWVLQQKEMFSGILRGLGSDEEETATYVLSTLRDRVLVPESLVPVGLRSVLFGSVTLEQLINISGRDDDGVATEVAKEVLFMVCTDPFNGLMPDAKALPVPLKGNLTRLLGVMKKLKATEVEFHRDLLLAIVRGRPSFGSAYLDEFPYNLEDHATWFAAVCLAADLISSVNAGLSFDFLDSLAQDPASCNSSEVQSIRKCIGPRSFTRVIMNKGLLHSDSRIKHGTLRLVSEALKLLDSLFCALNHRSDPSKQSGCKWASLKQDIQNEVQLLLPDHQVLLSLISSLNSRHKIEEQSLKRAADTDVLPEHSSRSKKLKTSSSNEEADILVGGISSSLDTVIPCDNGRIHELDNVNEPDNSKDDAREIIKLWESHERNNPDMAAEDEGTYFYSKLLDTLKIYHRTMPSVVEGSFDFFKVLPSNALSLPSVLQQSLLSLLVEHIGWSSKQDIPIRCPPLMYKHLMQFISLVIYSPVRDIKDQAYVLAQAAVLSTGAFDKNAREINAWFLFLPGFNTKLIEDKGNETIQNLSSIVVSFFCDVVSTIGNNLFKYWDLLRRQILYLEGVKDVNPHFSPLFVCVLEKCLRLLGSESGTFSLPEKSLISIYVSNTLRYLLQNQVEAGLLSSLIIVLLSKRLEDVDGDLSEWRPLKSLLHFSKSITDEQSRMFSLIDRNTGLGDDSFVSLLGEVANLSKSGHDSGISTAFSFSLLCVAPDLILQHFPAVVSISQNLCGVPFFILLSIFFLERGFLNDICKSWPEIFVSALERVDTAIQGENQSKGDYCSMDSTTSASVAFSYLLKQSPFYVLFPAIISTECLHLLESSKLQDLLLAKLSTEMPYNFVCSFRLVFFWFHHVQSSYRYGPVEEHVQISEICFTLIKSMLAHLSVGKHDSDCSNILLVPASNDYVQEIAETIFCHPVVTSVLESPLSGNEELQDNIFEQPTESFLCLAREGVHKMDYHVLKVLETFCNHLFTFSNGLKFPGEVGYANKCIVRIFKSLLQKLVLILKDRFGQFIKSDDLIPLIPTLFALHSLIQFISPWELLELAYWMFSQIDFDESVILESTKISALSVGLNIARCAFDLLPRYLQQPHVKEVPICFSGTEEFDVNLFERVYFHVVGIASHSGIGVADSCLLKAVEVANAHKGVNHRSLPLCMTISRVIASTPMNLLSRCIQKPSMTKAQLLFHLTESSLLHQSSFAYLFVEVVNKSLIDKRNGGAFHEDLVMLLPTFLSYLNSTCMKYGQKCYKHLGIIHSLYWEIFFDGFSNWKSFVSKDLFRVDLGGYVPSTVENLLALIDNSLLGRAVAVMRHYLVYSEVSVKQKKRLKLFDSVLPSGTDNLLDCSVYEIDHYSINQSLNTIIKAVTKILLCQMLIFPKENMIQVLAKEEEEVDGDVKRSSEVMSNKEYLRSVLLLNTLVSTWQLLVMKFPSKSTAHSEVEAVKCALFQLLEIYILRNLIKLAAEMHKSSVSKSNSLVNLEQLARSCFLHRFEDPAVLRMLRVILTSDTEDKSMHIRILQLLLAHSQFARTIQSVSKFSSSSQFGIIFRPMSSILRSLTFASMDHTALVRVDRSNTCELYLKQLEIVKLLRVLCRHRAQLCVLESEQDIGINSRELLFLLLSSYGATPSELDLEIYNLMRELESTDESNSTYIADMDYLWGNAAIRVRKSRETDQSYSSGDMDDAEAVEKHRKSQFRENLPIDPRICAATVLHFPYDRNISARTLFSSEFPLDNAGHLCEAQTTNEETRKRYDPVFILRMSLHGLSMGYIDPVEYASLGLLAVAFVSLSSPDDDVRKLGYKVLAVFRNVLEISRKRKDVIRLRPLMTYVQNGIDMPWRRIPSVHAIFAAEASLLLLDPSNDRYKTISKLVVHSPMNLKMIPFFDEFFWSSSPNFISDRIWMLRLLYSGLNIDEDAQIYVRNSVLEKLFNFYSSPLSDNESRELILQIVKRSVKFDTTSRYIIERCGVISWLSSLISNFCGSAYQEQRSVLLTQLTLILEVVNDIATCRNTIQWSQKYLEQLTQLSCQLYMLVAGSFELVKGIHMVDSILGVLASTLKISQKRDAFLPHFTLSVEGLFQLCEAIDVSCNGEHGPSAEIGLKVVLMSTPQAAIFNMDLEKLQKFVLWAASIALHSNSTIGLQSEESNYNLESCLEKEQTKETLLSKLLRWLTASVILGRLSRKCGDVESKYNHEKSNPETIQSLLRKVGQAASGSEELLAAIIYHFQQILGKKCDVLPSVVASLCLLLFPDSSQTGSDVLVDGGIMLTSLLSRIRYPAEANPSWRWSFDQPRKDPSTETYSVDEFQVCQSLLLVVSKVLGKKSSLSRYLSNADVENSGVFEWERSLLVDTE